MLLRFFGASVCLTLAPIHESIVCSGKAGLLACNIFAVLPIPLLSGQWT